jgi:hypothetical protein
MNKDAILATAIGFIIGLSITGSIVFGPKLFAMLPKTSIRFPSFFAAKTKPTPTTAPKEAAFSITIESPTPDSIAQDGDLLISGRTGSEATVVIQSAQNDTVVTATKDGKYAGKVTLLEGENTIAVTGYSDQKRATALVTVYYTEEEL